MIKKTKKLKILFLDILTDDEKLRKQIRAKVDFGKTYGEIFRNGFGLPNGSFVTKDASKGKLPDLIKYSAIVMGGSIEDPVEGKEKPWMKEVYKFIRMAKDNRIPILGICGGLQFTVRALGGKVVYNPKGRNFGTASTNLTVAGKRDPLFNDLPSKIVVQSSHKCIAEKLKSGWKLLASSGKSPFDAIAIGNNIRLLQFHPELGVKNIRALAEMRKNALVKEGFVKQNEFSKFIKSFKDTSRAGKTILGNFVKYFVQKNIVDF